MEGGRFGVKGLGRVEDECRKGWCGGVGEGGGWRVEGGGVREEGGGEGREQEN